MKTCFVLRHVPFESLGLLEPLLIEREFSIQVLDVPLGDLSRVEADAELVVVLGGPISVYEEHWYPFLTDELRVIERRLHGSLPTLGICLGAQLMARALGARVYAGAEKEIGWAPVTLTPQGQRSVLSAIEGQSVLHWHGDTFDLPKGATLLASTSVTPHQAFLWEGVAVALQFHLEVMANELEAWYVGHTAELARWGRRTVPELRADGLTFAPMLRPHAVRSLGMVLEGCLNASAW
jgi:GMP synthase (glutamine-hydrolysing)